MVEIYVRNFLNSCGLFFYQGFSSLNWLKPLVKKTAHKSAFTRLP